MRLALMIIILTIPAMAAAVPFADGLVDYKPGPGQWAGNSLYNKPERVLGRPYGAGTTVADNTSVATLGDGGSITLSFSEPVTDDPANPGGYDFIVFSNSIMVGGNVNYRWQELAFVEISQDGSEWFLILPSILPSQLRGGIDTGQSYTLVRNYAEYTPTLSLPPTRTPEEFYCVPDRQSEAGNVSLLAVDVVSGGGDAFDIAQAVKQASSGVPLVDQSGQPMPAGISWFRYVRITDALTGDTQGSLGEVSAEIDAVADVRPGESIGSAKQKADGYFAVINDAVVTAVFPGEIFIEENDRSSAIKLVTTFQTAPGDLVRVTGHISTLSEEKVIADPLITVLSSGNDIKPLGMNCGRSSSSQALLVKTWGWVKSVEADWFTISDGSADVKVSVGMLTLPEADSFCAVTGVVGIVNGETVLRPRVQEDVQTFEVGSF